MSKTKTQEVQEKKVSKNRLTSIRILLKNSQYLKSMKQNFRSLTTTTAKQLLCLFLLSIFTKTFHKN